MKAFSYLCRISMLYQHSRLTVTQLYITERYTSSTVTNPLHAQPSLVYQCTYIYTKEYTSLYIIYFVSIYTYTAVYIKYTCTRYANILFTQTSVDILILWTSCQWKQFDWLSRVWFFVVTLPWFWQLCFPRSRW